MILTVLEFWRGTGAGRLRAPDEDWNGRFEELARSAAGIFVVHSHRTGTKWEIDWLQNHSYLGKYIFVMLAIGECDPNLTLAFEEFSRICSPSTISITPSGRFAGLISLAAAVTLSPAEASGSPDVQLWRNEPCCNFWNRRSHGPVRLVAYPILWNSETAG